MAVNPWIAVLGLCVCLLGISVVILSLGHLHHLNWHRKGLELEQMLDDPDDD